ncbi:hypothetical protein [Cloacibacillus porcorum]|uniref:Uncharacterized protein n=1 Tax=Cloacibacillus porcorum TaxID=1197717 RepID=A0A1B2I2M6_9BACT|nr:hypothetical protein [Cloacibacillus porcorum]ANZ44197.1 hypothetical protein BED41_03295 [Cloacibacillus porcorum]
MLTKIKIKSITLLKCDINKVLLTALIIVFCFLFVVYCSNIELFEKKEFLTVAVIPFFIGVFSSLLLAIFINWGHARIENSRLVLIRNEVLHPIFFSLSSFFAGVADCVLCEKKNQGIIPEKGKYNWMEWFQAFYELNDKTNFEFHGVFERKEKYMENLNGKASAVVSEINGILIQKESLYLSSILTRDEMHHLEWMKNIFGDRGKCFHDAMDYHHEISAMKESLYLIINKFPDLNKLNDIKFDSYGILWEEEKSMTVIEKIKSINLHNHRKKVKKYITNIFQPLLNLSIAPVTLSEITIARPYLGTYCGYGVCFLLGWFFCFVTLKVMLVLENLCR